MYPFSTRENVFLPDIMSNMIFSEKIEERDTSNFCLKSRFPSCIARTVIEI